MKGHRYRVTLEHIAPAREGQEICQEPLVFEALCHDEIIGIVDRLRDNEAFSLDKDEAAQLGVGLKLFSEVVIARKKDSPFQEMFQALVGFIGSLKATLKKD